MMKGKKKTAKDRWIRVYALLDPDTRVVKYVGRTYQEISYRRSAHIKRAKEGKDTPIYRWIRELIAERRMPKIILADKVREREWDDNESKAIAKFVADGFTLLNTYQTGDDDETTEEASKGP